MDDGLKQYDDTEPRQEPEKRHFEDLVVLGNAVPDEISDNRKTVCTVAFSEECGLVRIYPVPTDAPMKRWKVVSIPLERNPKDSRKESWKIQGSRAEWDTLSQKIKVTGELSRPKKLDLISRLKEKYSYGCIEDMNEQKTSLGLIVPEIIGKKFEERKDVDTTIQSTLVDKDLFMTIRNYAIRPVISYRCPECKSKNPHKQGVLEWGAYEWLRKGDDRDQLWENLHIGDPDYDHVFLVGNMNLHRSSFMIISLFRFKMRDTQETI